MAGRHPESVVDDEENIRSWRRRCGSMVRSACARGEAPTQAEAMVRVITVDVMSPEIEGFDVLRRLRNSGNNAPVLRRPVDFRDGSGGPRQAG